MEINNRKTMALMRVMLLLYLLLVVKLIILKYPMSREMLLSWSPEVVTQKISSANFTPLDTIKMYIQYHHQLNSFENLVGNVVAFIPLGILLPMAFKKTKGFFTMCFYSLLIISTVEFTQLFTGLGEFDVDDILLNFAGAITGYILWRKLYKEKKRNLQKR